MLRTLVQLVPRRFSVRALLLLVFVLAGILSYYGNWLRLIQAEQNKLAGKWFLVDPNGGVVWVDGKKVDVIFSSRDTRVLLPRGRVGQFDHYESGWSTPIRAIYRIEGHRITVSQAERGETRPVDFDVSKGYSVWTCERAWVGTSPSE